MNRFEPSPVGIIKFEREDGRTKYVKTMLGYAHLNAAISENGSMPHPVLLVLPDSMRHQNFMHELANHPCLIGLEVKPQKEIDLEALLMGAKS